MSDTAIRTLDDLPPLAKGAHAPDSGRACMMEAAAYIAGEPWSDHPACVCPVIAAFARKMNDAVPDDMRDALLRPLVQLTVGTRASSAVERRRAYIAADFAVRQVAPAALRAAGLHAKAGELAALPAVTSKKTAAAANAAAANVANAARAAYAAANAAYAAANAANAAADAADAANAANAAAANVANAARAAYAAANAAADAADAANAANAAGIWGEAADCIRRMCEEK
jgi:hypothetical protein